MLTRAAAPLALAPLDWSVMAGYGALVLGIGWWANRRQRDSEDYFLGGRRMRWWAVGVSLIATSFSSASLIGGTGEGYAHGMQWMMLQAGDLLALVAVSLVFLPFFSRLRLTTAYEYLERRFGVVARSTASLLFLGQTLLRTSLLVYAPALALATVLDCSVTTAIVGTAAAAVLYSAFGGIGAVVWTDLLQMTVIVFAVAYSLVLVSGDVGFGALVEHAGAEGRLALATPGADPAHLTNPLGALVPYAVLAFSLFGTGQQAVQRFLSVRDLRAARRAALLGWAVGAFSLLLTLFLGACLGSWAQAREVDLAEGGANQVLPAFMTERLPEGLQGLMLAAIFAASMSSLDSAIHSMSTACLVDFVRRFRRRPLAPRVELRLARVLTAAFGVVSVLGALYAAGRDEHLLRLLVKWLGYFAGPLLGLFLLGVFSRRANERGALVGVATGFLLTLGLAWGAPESLWERVHPLWLAPFACAVTLLRGWLASWRWPPPAPERLRGLVRGSPADAAAGAVGRGSRL